MTSHTITDPPHRRLGNPKAKFEAWIETSDGHYVELQISSGATQEQAEWFVREAVAAPELLAALENIVPRFKRCIIAHGNSDEIAETNLKDARAAIAKATGTAP